MKKRTLNLLLIYQNIQDANFIQKCISGNIDHTIYNVTHVKEVTGALKLLNEQVFDAILIGIETNLHGIEILKSIRKFVPSTPIIAISEIDDVKISDETIELGAEDYLIKNKIDCNLLTRSIEYSIHRKRTETLLRISEERYRTFFENTKEVFYRTDLNGIIKFISPSVKYFGYSTHEIIDKDVRTFFENPSYRDILLDILTKEKAIYDFELSLKLKDGKIIPISLSAILINDNSGKPTYIDGIFRDITKDKQSELAIKESEAKYGTIVNNIFDIIYTASMDGTLTFISPNIKRYGFDPTEVIGQNIFDFIHPDDREKALRDFERTIKTNEEFITELRLLKKNGGYFHAEEIGKITWRDGKPVQIIGVIRDITDRKNIEEQYYHLFESNPNPMWVYDLETLAFLEINEAAVKHYGYSRDEFLSMTLKDIRPQEEIPKLLENIKTSRDSYQKSNDWKHKKKDGTIIDVEITSHSITWRGKPARVVVVNDITEKKQAEKALRESEEKFRTIASMNIAAIFIYKDAKFIYVNPATEIITGYTTTELLQKNFWDIVHPDFRQLIKERGIARLNGKEVPSQYEFKIVTKNGEEKWLSFSAEKIQYQGEKAVLGVAFDITHRKQSDQVQSALYRIAKVTDNAKDLDTLYKGVHGIISELMDARNFYIALYDAEKDLISFPYYVDETDFRPTPKKPGKGMTEYVLRTGKSCLSDLNHFLELHRRGEIELIGEPSPIWLGIPLKINNKTIGVMAIQHYSNPNAYGEREQKIFEFISSEVARAIEHKRAEEKFQLLATAFESAANAIVITDREGNITWANNALTQITGYSINELIGKNPRIFKSGKQDTAFYENLWNTITTGKVWRGEFINKKKDGTLYNEEITITPMFDKKGNITNFIGVKQDITDKKKFETQLLRSQRMESLGVLAGGIAHDLNNVLAPIMMGVELLSKNNDEAQKKAMLEILRSSAARGANIVKQILTFSRGADGERSLLQSKHLVREIENFAKQTFPKEIEIHVEVAKDLWTLVGDATQIHQILLNLCVNAKDAMPKGGKLFISAENIYLDDSYAKMHSDAKPGPYVVFKVSDTGTGIPDSIINKIFDPFFTTKEIGKGTGLGLSTVLGIVKNYRGFINVYSEVGKGTEFKVYLPASEVTNQKTVESSNNKFPRGKGELILVVDDEISIREITKQTLETYGYNVITASDGVEAIALFAQNKDKVKLVLTDMAMPVLGGASTIKAIQKINPSILVIATSGLLNQKIDTETLGPVLKGFLQKPYTSEKLLKTVYDVLKNS